MGYTARDIMSTEVICVHEETDLRDLAKMFLEQGITGAPVVDKDGSLVGVISQTDLLYYQLTRDDELVLNSDFYSSVRVEGRPLPSGFQIEDVNTGRVADVMTPVVHSVSPAADVEAIARMMTAKHIHRVIVRQGRKAVGIISALDVLRVIHRVGSARPAPTARPGARTKATKGRAKVAARR